MECPHACVHVGVCACVRMYVTKHKKPTNWWGRQNAVPLKFDSKQSEAAFSTVFFLDNSRPEVVGHVISSVAAE